MIHPIPSILSPHFSRFGRFQVVGVANAVAQQQLLEVEAQAMAKAPLPKSMGKWRNPMEIPWKNMGYMGKYMEYMENHGKYIWYLWENIWRIYENTMEYMGKCMEYIWNTPWNIWKRPWKIAKIWELWED